MILNISSVTQVNFVQKAWEPLVVYILEDRKLLRQLLDGIHGHTGKGIFSTNLYLYLVDVKLKFRHQSQFVLMLFYFVQDCLHRRMLIVVLLLVDYADSNTVFRLVASANWGVLGHPSLSVWGILLRLLRLRALVNKEDRLVSDLVNCELNLSIHLHWSLVLLQVVMLDICEHGD